MVSVKVRINSRARVSVSVRVSVLVDAAGEGGAGAIGMDTVRLDPACLDHGAEAWDEVGGEVEPHFDVVKSKGEEFLNHGFAGFMPARIPSGCDTEYHGLKKNAP